MYYMFSPKQCINLVRSKFVAAKNALADAEREKERALEEMKKKQEAAVEEKKVSQTETSSVLPPTASSSAESSLFSLGSPILSSDSDESPAGASASASTSPAAYAAGASDADKHVEAPATTQKPEGPPSFEPFNAQTSSPAAHGNSATNNSTVTAPKATASLPDFMNSTHSALSSIPSGMSMDDINDAADL